MTNSFLRFLVVSLAAASLLLTAGAVQSQETKDTATAINSDEVSFDENASTPDLLESAREMFLADNYVLAEMLYKSVLVREPNHLDAMLELAIVYEAMGKLEYARGLLTRAALLKPGDNEIMRRGNDIAKKLGASLEDEIDMLLEQEQFEAAVPKLSVLLTTQPENAELYYKRAQCHLALGNPASAVEDVGRALDLRSDDRYFQLKGKALALQNRLEIRTLTAEAKRSILSGTQEGREKAIAAVSSVLELDPDNVWAQEAFRDLTEKHAAAEAAAPKNKLTAFWHNVQDASGPVAGTFVAFATFVEANLWMLLAVLAVLLIFNSPLTRFLMRGVGPDQLLGGQTERFSLTEIMMLIHSHNATGALRVRGDSNGEIFFHNGEITHAKTSRLAGEDALRALVQSSEGSFVFTESDIPAERTIHAPLTLVLMELPSRPATYSMQEQGPRVEGSRIKALLDAKQ